MWILNSMQLIITLIEHKVQKSLQGVKCTGHANSKQLSTLETIHATKCIAFLLTATI